MGILRKSILLCVCLAFNSCGWVGSSSGQRGDSPRIPFPGSPPQAGAPPGGDLMDFGEGTLVIESPGADTREPKINVSLSADLNLEDELVWTATWDGGVYIAVIEWDFGGAAPNIPETPIDWDSMDVWNIPLVPIAESPTSVSIKAIRDGQYFCKVTVTDYEGSSGSAFHRFGPDPDNKEAEIIDDRIYAYYDKGQASIAEEILVTVTTGLLPHSFQFMLGVGLVLDEDAEYVAKSFNVGSPGGDVDDPDGIWVGVDPLTFFLPPDRLYQPGANPNDSLGTTNRFDFNVSPLAGHDISQASGDLFNIRVKHSEPGLKTLTFQQRNGVNRTYYSGLEDGENRIWDDCSNWHPGLQTSIVID